MAIQQYYEKPTRKVIGILAEEPPDDATITLAGFEVCRLSEADFRDTRLLGNIAAVVLQQQENHPNRIKRDLERHAEVLLWHDCRVIVQVLETVSDSDPTHLWTRVFKVIEELNLPTSGLRQHEQTSSDGGRNAPILTPMVHVISSSDILSEISTILRTCPPDQPPFKMLEIVDGNDNSLIPSWSPEKTTLLQRAFHDCIKVMLIKNSAGLSGVSTYQVYATHQNDFVGNLVPYQYFIKIGDRQKISKEYLAYRDIALEHIPFHLGPRLRLNRCVLGTKLGIIVSDYVSGAESLSNCAKNDRAVPSIANLFNTTLRAWRDTSTSEDGYSLQHFLENKMPKKIPMHRRNLICDLGGTRKPKQLKKLLKKIPPGKVQVGVIHGDLHAMNVLVRGGDAILIDFEKFSERAPLLFDFASVEAGLLVHGFIGDRRTGSELLASVDNLYDVDALVNHKISSCKPGDSSAWFFDCARQIRLQAQQIESVDSQYAVILAVVLSRKACNPKKFNDDADHSNQLMNSENLRALAFVLAERILLRIFCTNTNI